MEKLFSAKRIYMDCDTDQQVIVEITFKWEDVLDMASGEGVPLRFPNKQPKTRIFLTHDRTFWLLASYTTMRSRWNAYLQGKIRLKDLPAPSDN